MNTALRLTILQGAEQVLTLEAWEPIIIGRQTGHDEKPPSHRLREQKCRVVLAGRDSSVLSRQHLLIQAQGDGRIRVTNESHRHGVVLPNRAMLRSRESEELSLPASLGIADWVVRIEAPDTEATPLRALEQTPPLPLTTIGVRRPFAPLATPLTDENASEFYLRLIEVSLIRLQAAGDAKTLLDQAAHCGAELLELDSVWALLLEEGKWVQKTSARRDDLPREKAGEPSNFVLGKVRDEKRAFWMTAQTVGLGVLPSVVAAPILDAQGAVIGAIYGHRLTTSGEARVPFNRLMALCVELLASAVSSGLAARALQKPGETAMPSSDFFFPAAAARRALESPQILDDRKQEIALLECEIRDFDTLFAKVGASEAALCLQEILNPLTEIIAEQQGVVDEYRDASVRAFWGAPVAQADFAGFAARAATIMLERLPELGRRWRTDLGRPLELGIILDLGAHYAGRRGSRIRFKYGPWASAWAQLEKIQHASRVLRTPLLLSAPARSALQALPGRRLGKLEGAGWAEPLELFEVVYPTNKAYAIRGSYEEALAAFERGEFDAAAQGVGRLLAEHPSDVPASLLQMRAIQAKLHNNGASPAGVLKLFDMGA
jgi:adenylate cyclase